MPDFKLKEIEFFSDPTVDIFNFVLSFLTNPPLSADAIKQIPQNIVTTNKILDLLSMIKN